MKRSKRTLALLLMLVMLVSALTVGVSAEYSPLSGSYSDTRYLTPSGYSEEELAAFPVKDFLEQLTDSSGNARPISADKIAWTRDGSDNYTVSDAETGTIDLRFNGQTNFYVYMVAGSGRMLDMDGNTRYVIEVHKGKAFSNLKLFWTDEDGQEQACENPTKSEYDFGGYTEYYLGYFPEPEQAKGLRLRVELAAAAEDVKLYKGWYSSVEAAESSGKEVETTAVENAYEFAVEDGYNDLCVVTENGSVKSLYNVRFYVYERGRGYNATFLKDGNTVSVNQISWNGVWKYELKNRAYRADDEYALKLRYSRPVGGTGDVNDIQSAYVDDGSEDIKDQLFGESGYTANYSGNGHTFEITDNYEVTVKLQIVLVDEKVQPVDPSEKPAYDDGDPYFQAKSTAVESGYVSNYVMTPQSDSLYSSSENCYQTILLLPGGDAVLDMSQLKPTFYTGTGVQAYAKSVGEAGAVKQTSGQSVVDFTTSPVQYTAKDGADKSIKNYWVTYQAQQEAATLFVNGPSFDELQTEKVADKDKREVYLNTADDYHDIFFANLGKEELTGLSVSLDEEAQKTLKLDDFWTIEDGDALNDFDTCSSDIKSAAKIRLRLKDAPENLETTEISGVLSVVSNAGTKYIYLTGSILPEIVTESVPNGVKYVPYSVMVQTNNHDDASKVTFSVDSGSLPNGVSLNENTGEIYGVPTKTGTYKFSIKASFSAEGASASVKEYTIEVAENTDANVEKENEHPILNYVYDMGENGGIDDWKGKFHEQDFRVDHTYAEFVKFFIDGDLLKEGKDYESSEGSTKITIYRKTFERYGNGKHTIAAEFRNSDNTMTKSTQNYEANVKIKVNQGSSSAPIASPNKPTTPATPSQSTGRFIDVNKPDWFYDNVMWAAEQGYMVGVSANRFAPKQNTTQAMVVTVLARIAKVDLTAYAGGAQANWYTSAANWAQSLGMISLDTFEPNAPIRRGDLAVMLLKYFDGIKVSYGVPKQQERVNFFDAAEMTAEEELAFQCCYKEKIFLGNGKNDMQPNGFTTRAQLAALIERIAGHVEVNGK